ncbi:hypothetical protein PPERSA_02184 [Pseudocohnilembus persalinus]|uniref:Uncharacterized protein n=1 Tax=Pseudocohnilembus persalinus TaxID=266149 RepID=A0A0V0QG85_PSEPJ|nr:hypothetical protein PPERSA_02184 [Pseudocohnilembus persalinus]|eukprot:KRX01088.1 hypothetical protein PPERSA_02184 [Pseudocohnilembus persalinus]
MKKKFQEKFSESDSEIPSYLEEKFELNNNLSSSKIHNGRKLNANQFSINPKILHKIYQQDELYEAAQNQEPLQKNQQQQNQQNQQIQQQNQEQQQTSEKLNFCQFSIPRHFCRITQNILEQSISEKKDPRKSNQNSPSKLKKKNSCSSYSTGLNNSSGLQNSSRISKNSNIFNSSFQNKQGFLNKQSSFNRSSSLNKNQKIQGNLLEELESLSQYEEQEEQEEEKDKEKIKNSYYSYKRKFKFLYKDAKYRITKIIILLFKKYQQVLVLFDESENLNRKQLRIGQKILDL